jgi:hypothetical protein
MKRHSLWAGIIGALLVVGDLLAAATALSHPTDLVSVNVTKVITDLLWVGLGVFLIVVFFTNRQREDSGSSLPAALEPSSPDDIQSLSRGRNRILGYVLVVEMIVSAESWLLNNYAAGLTLTNTEIILDVLFNAVFFYIAIQLFRNKKPVLKPLLYTVILYTVIDIIIQLLRHEWFFVISSVLFAFYFVYAITAPLNRKNHRIVHIFVLPAVLVLMTVASYLANRMIDQRKHQMNTTGGAGERPDS